MNEESDDPLKITSDRILLDVKAFPSASKNELVGIQAGRLRIRIASVAEDGKANLALRQALAKLLSCPKSDIRLESGAKSQLKTLSFPLRLEEKLRDLLEG
ncbi:hypothetical protein MASR2M78_03560 [Treponema sp.]